MESSENPFLPPRSSARESSGVKLPLPGVTPGAALFWRSEESGWSHPPLLLPNPVLLLRVNWRGTQVMTPEGEIVAESPDGVFTPFQWIEEILNTLRESSAGTERKLFTAPAFPLATVCASYEFGRFFQPHEQCFPHAQNAEVDDLVVGFHSTGFVLRKERWDVVGRPPVQRTRWKNWEVSDRLSDWPKPPSFYREQTRVEASEDAFEPVDLRGKILKPSMSYEHYRTCIDRIQQHLHAGDIYQANMTVRFEGRTALRPEQVFREGIMMGGDRYAAMFNGFDCSHVSFSPELLVKKWGRSISTRPIKGTRRRPPAAEMNNAIRELALSPKDRAEHVMIVDLERNDLGRLCEYGTVRVDPLMAVTQHPNLLHLESTVTGTTRSNVGVREIFSAIFPGGSISGAPKKRALEIIGDLENRPRGVYCGAMGWIDHRGDCELNLPIRTSTIHGDGRLRLYAGGGVVADSTAEGEWTEMQAKLEFMKAAFAAAER